MTSTSVVFEKNQLQERQQTIYSTPYNIIYAAVDLVSKKIYTHSDFWFLDSLGNILLISTEIKPLMCHNPIHRNAILYLNVARVLKFRYLCISIYHWYDYVVP